VRRFVQEFSEEHAREFHGISAEAMQALVNYSWPGNVRELRNLIESMVVLATGREIGVADIPKPMREGGSDRLLPVPMGPIHREESRAEGRELEFIVRSLVEVKLQLEELRRRVDEVRSDRDAAQVVGGAPALGAGALEPPAPPPPAAVSITPGMTMAEIEKAAIVAALRETRGNRRKAAEILDIGERTLYRKLKEYQVPEQQEY
jgi:DNA-binding NtrC family response regulator